jgi:hypothetical protein
MIDTLSLLPVKIIDNGASTAPRDPMYADYRMAIKSGIKDQGLDPFIEAINAINTAPNHTLTDKIGKEFPFTKGALSNTTALINGADKLALNLMEGQMAGAFIMATGQKIADYESTLMDRIMGDANLALIGMNEWENPIVQESTRFGVVHKSRKILVVGYELPLMFINGPGAPLLISSRIASGQKTKEAVLNSLNDGSARLTNCLIKMLSGQLGEQNDVFISPKYAMEQAVIGRVPDTEKIQWGDLK